MLPADFFALEKNIWAGYFCVSLSFGGDEKDKVPQWSQGFDFSFLFLVHPKLADVHGMLPVRGRHPENIPGILRIQLRGVRDILQLHFQRVIPVIGEFHASGRFSTLGWRQSGEPDPFRAAAAQQNQQESERPDSIW